MDVDHRGAERRRKIDFRWPYLDAYSARRLVC